MLAEGLFFNKQVSIGTPGLASPSPAKKKVRLYYFTWRVSHEKFHASCLHHSWHPQTVPTLAHEPDTTVLSLLPSSLLDLELIGRRTYLEHKKHLLNPHQSLGDTWFSD